MLLVVSGCVLDELRRLDEAGVGGDAMSGSVFVAKRFELRNCRHSGQGFDSSACIKDLIGLDNPHHYAVAAQNVELRGALREILGVPLILINRGVLVMEQPSKATIDQARKIELNKLKASEFENKAISKILADKADPEAEKQAKPEKRKRKKKNKSQPNPLSVKRSKKDQNTVESTQSSGVAVVGKPKRKRRSKKKVAPTDTL